MKQLFTIVLGLFLCLTVQAQMEFHVFPDGKPTGIGSLQNPWDLQTALNQKPEVVNGDDTIWLHGGVYNGRFVSTIHSTIPNKFITVAPFSNENVIINGNVSSDLEAVLNVKGGSVVFRDFEITWLGDFSRNESDENFQVCAGVSHTSGEDCRFYNLNIHDNPGLGFGSWKATGGTMIENCKIYYNGYVAKNGKGRGEGMYVQNQSEKTRLIKNNLIFSNYYKGIEVWSAGRHKTFQFVKNITIQDNVIFNSGLPSGDTCDNIIIATDDRNGINIANNIKVLNNVLYHNTEYTKNEVNGDAPSLTLGFTDSAPVENILVTGNVILGRNNSLRLLHVKSITFKNNTIYGGYVHLNQSEMPYSNQWKFYNNTYFTKKTGAFRIYQDQTYALKNWQTKFKLDTNSTWQHISNFNLPTVLKVSQQTQKPLTFTVALFDKQGDDVEVDFSQYGIFKDMTFKIYDVENSKEVLASGTVATTLKVRFPMHSVPIHNDKIQKTSSNFGVFIIAFEAAPKVSKESVSGFQKLLKWLGL